VKNYQRRYGSELSKLAMLIFEGWRKEVVQHVDYQMMQRSGFVEGLVEAAEEKQRTTLRQQACLR
jgi:hypothetical protein